MHTRNDYTDRILAQYDEKRRNARYALDERRTQVYDKCPGVKELELRVARDSFERGKRSILLGESDALNGLEEANRELAAQKEKLLVENGFPADYLKMRYECDICKDTGYIGNDRCDCFKKALSKLLLKDSNMESLLEEENFKTFDTSLFSNDPADRDPVLGVTPYENIMTVLGKAKRFVDSFDSEHGNILIYGPTGVGKTFLSSCIAKALIDTSHSVLYHSATGLFSALEAARFGSENRDAAKKRRRTSLNVTCSSLTTSEASFTRSSQRPRSSMSSTSGSLPEGRRSFRRTFLSTTSFLTTRSARTQGSASITIFTRSWVPI